MARYRMTPKRRAALRKAQLASARKRKRGLSRKTKRRIATGIVAGVAVGSVLGYRAYDRRVEERQRAHLHTKAFTARKKLPIWDSGDLLIEPGKLGKQPRRYRKRPASVQSIGTIRSTRAKKYGRAGRAVNTVGRTVKYQAPYAMGGSVRKPFMAKAGGPRVKYENWGKLDKRVTVRVANRYATGYVTRRSRKYYG